MAITFSADEVFEMAEQIERNGANFYRKAAKGSSDAKMKKLLEGLAAMEVSHERTFAAMRAQLGPGEQPTVLDPDNEGALYLRAMADGRVIDVKTDPSEQLTGQETVEDILTTAIGIEKDSVVFYLGLEESVSAAAGKAKVRDIIKDEMKHITLLLEQKSMVK